MDQNYTKVKVKGEPMDTGEVKDEVKGEGVKPVVDANKMKPQDRQISCAELFTDKTKSGRFYSCNGFILPAKYSLSVIYGDKAI